MGGSGGGILYGPRASFPPPRRKLGRPLCYFVGHSPVEHFRNKRNLMFSLVHKATFQPKCPSKHRTRIKARKEIWRPPRKTKKKHQTLTEIRNPAKPMAMLSLKPKHFKQVGMVGVSLLNIQFTYVYVICIYIYVEREYTYIYIQMCLLMNLSREPPQSVCGHASPPN